MATYQSQYKVKNGFGDIKMNRAFRMKMHDIKRREKRVESFAKNRDLEDTNLTVNTDDKDDRYYKLLRWKAERDRRKNLEQVKKKPAFKVGVVHHSYYSPPLKDSVTLSPAKKCLHGRKKVTQPVSPPKRITRATQKRLIKKLEVPQQKKITEIKQELFIEKEKKNAPVKNEKKPLVPNNYKFTAPSGLTNIPIFGCVTMLSTPIKIHRSIEKRKSAKVFSMQRNSNISSSKHDKEETNKECATFDVEKNTSIETANVKLSSDKHEMTFDCPIEEGELLRNSTFSDSNHSLVISSPGNISAIQAENTPLTDSQSNNKGNIFFQKNIPEKNTRSKTSESTDNNQTKMKTPLRSDSKIQTNINSPKDPVFFSPYVVLSRGKNNARKEQQIRRGIGSSSFEDIPTKETVMKNLNISLEDEERTAQYFSFLLNKETERLNELCKKWTEIQSKSDITEDAQYRINQAVGQTHLLINKKFDRFRRLVSDCETGKGEMLVTCRDLQGFWDMMYMEIMNCDSRFEVLEKLRSNDWKEEEPIATKVTLKKKIGSKKKVVPRKQSSVQNFILAAKRKMKNKEEILENHTNKNINQLSTSIDNVDKEQEKAKVLRKSNTRQSLLQKTLLSESCKKTVQTPMTIMKISQMCKTPKIELDDSISYINCKQTPSKGILKRTDDSSIPEARYTKSMQKVNFDDHITLQEVPVDEEIQNKLDLAARLERIANYDFDAQCTTNRNRSSIKSMGKLNFDDSSFLDSSCNLEDTTKQLNLLDVTEKNDNILKNFEIEYDENISSKNDDIPLETSLKECTQNEINTKILRNRVIVTDDSTRIFTGRKSSKVLIDENKDHQKENKSPEKLKKGSQQMQNKIKQNTSLTNVTPVNVRKNLRRSSRKSVRFNAEECNACSEIKPVHPMTPHARRSKVSLDLSYLQGNNTIVQTPSPSKDLITWDSPKIPARVRRSSRNSKKHFL